MFLNTTKNYYLLSKTPYKKESKMDKDKTLETLEKILDLFYLILLDQKLEEDSSNNEFNGENF